MKCPKCDSNRITTQDLIWCNDCGYVINEQENDKISNEISKSDVIEYLQKYQNWRRGKHDLTMDEAGLDSFKIGVMLDKAIEFLK